MYKHPLSIAIYFLIQGQPWNITLYYIQEQDFVEIAISKNITRLMELLIEQVGKGDYELITKEEHGMYVYTIHGKQCQRIKEEIISLDNEIRCNNVYRGN